MQVIYCRLHEQFDAKNASKLAGLSLKQFKSTISKVNTLIGQSVVFKQTKFNHEQECKRIAVTFGCQFLLDEMLYLLAKLADEMSTKIEKIHVACVVYLCCKLNKVNLEVATDIKSKISIQDVWDGPKSAFDSMSKMIRAGLAQEIEELVSRLERKQTALKKASDVGKSTPQRTGSPATTNEIDASSTPVQSHSQFAPAPSTNPCKRKATAQIGSGINSMVRSYI